MASQPVKPSVCVQWQRIWWAQDRRVFCGLCLYSQTAFYLWYRKECQTQSLYWVNESRYTIYLASCLWVPRRSALQNRMRSCTVGWCLFLLRNSSSLQLFVVLHLFSTTVWAPVYQSLLHLIDHFRDYDDFVVCDFLEVGLNCASSFLTDQFSCNHKGTMHFFSTVDSYLSVELQRSAVISPFSSNSFRARLWFCC